MIRRVMSRLKRRGGQAFDYGLVAASNPKLFFEAARHVITRRQRGALSVMNATTNPSLRSPKQTHPVTAQTLIEGLSQVMGVVDLGHGPKGYAIGVADSQFLSALIYLNHQACGPKISINRREVNFATANFKHLALRAQTVEVTFVDLDLDHSVISVEAYFRRETGEWISSNKNNQILRAIRSDLLVEPGLTPATDILGGPTLHARVEDLPVDAVYTWVNHEDPDWIEAYAKHCGTIRTTTDANSLSRFHSNDELRYSLRSVVRNAPWINRIFVLTNCTRPDWLSDEDPRLIWVDHAKAIPAIYLPTFNSHVIESCLHRIPDLSEHFIYLNDDVFLARPLRKSFFFDQAGSSRSFLEPYGMVSGAVREGDPDYLNASRNVAGLLNADMGFVPTQLHQHTAFALRRSVLADIEARWPGQFKALRANRLRTSGDLNVTSFLYHHYALSTGQAQVGKVSNAFIKSLDVRRLDKLKDAKRPVYDTICINEGGSHDPGSDWHLAVRAFLQDRFPDKALWER